MIHQYFSNSGHLITHMAEMKHGDREQLYSLKHIYCVINCYSLHPFLDKIVKYSQAGSSSNIFYVIVVCTIQGRIDSKCLTVHLEVRGIPDDRLW